MSNVEVIYGEWPVVRPNGEIDFTNVKPFNEALDATAIESPKGFTIDLGHVTYFDSAGFNAIVRVYTRIHDDGGTLALVVNTKNVKTLIEALHLDFASGIIICSSVEAAHEALSSGHTG